MTIWTRDDHDGVVRVFLDGELDIVTANRYQKALRAATTAWSKTLIIDLGRLTFCGATGKRVFIGALRFDGDRGVSIHPENAKARAASVLVAAGVRDEQPPPVAAIRSRRIDDHIAGSFIRHGEERAQG